MTDWSLWVLDNGLPALPPNVAVGESVPVARWNGREFGAVLHVQWRWSDSHDDDELQNEIEVFRRRQGEPTWEVATARGGGGWFSPPMSRPVVPESNATVTDFFATGEGTWKCCAAYGFAGSKASLIEVTDSAGVTRSPLESPLGVFVVAADGEMPATVRVLTEGGSVLLSRVFSPATDW